MQVTLGKKWLSKTHQNDFPETASCCYCKGEARIGFVAHEGFGEESSPYDQVSF